MNYLIMQHPGHNRVYYNAATAMALAELKLASQRMSLPLTQLEIVELANVRYVSFATDGPLNEGDIAILSRLSFVFALFRKEIIEEQPYLFPLAKLPYAYLDEKLSSVQKYQGKTNELFTRMMLNVALLSSDFSYDERLQLLDPVAGRGTTLFEASIFGYHAFGIEVETKSVHDTAIFFKKYLEAERVKHQYVERQIAGERKSNAVVIKEFKYAISSQDFKSKTEQKSLGLVCGSSQFASRFFKPSTFHLIVGDLPYGIVHGNSGAKKTASITRNPSELLELCLAAWYTVLKPGGVVVVAWNAFLVSRHQLGKLFMDHGFDVMDQPPYDAFEHMVDKSIKRDIIVAKKRS